MAETLGEYMRKHRKRAKLSQQEAADAVPVSRATFSGWENDHSAPTVTQLRATLDRYGVPNEDRRGLLDGTPLVAGAAA